eukprot:TRINITY_DN9441_c1_g1_i1.p1 TRINITY_DN9441_c1_g1~~TRINITY_DN9441_c1_g1_i1.p1  ORF type:complete len:1050 (+),score=271.25 TRINITY_DN9441_c1_g1_i1:276-3152(+)
MAPATPAEPPPMPPRPPPAEPDEAPAAQQHGERPLPAISLQPATPVCSITNAAGQRCAAAAAAAAAVAQPGLATPERERSGTWQQPPKAAACSVPPSPPRAASPPPASPSAQPPRVGALSPPPGSSSPVTDERGQLLGVALHPVGGGGRRRRGPGSAASLVSAGIVKSPKRLGPRMIGAPPKIRKLKLSEVERASHADHEPRSCLHRLAGRIASRSRRPIPKRAMYRLGPIDKLRLHCRVPWTLLLHCTLLALVLVEVLHYQTQRNDGVRHHLQTLAGAFAPELWDRKGVPWRDTPSRYLLGLRDDVYIREFCDVADLLAIISASVENYYALPFLSPGLYQHFAQPYNGSAEILRPLMRVSLLRPGSNATLMSNPDGDWPAEDHYWELTAASPYGPFAAAANDTDNFGGTIGTGFDPAAVVHDCSPVVADDTDLPYFPCRTVGLDLFDLTQAIDVTYDIRGNDLAGVEFDEAQVYEWTCTQSFRLSQHSGVGVLELDVRASIYAERPGLNSAAVFTLLLGLLAFVSVTLWLRELCRDMRRDGGRPCGKLRTHCCDPYDADGDAADNESLLGSSPYSSSSGRLTDDLFPNRLSRSWVLLHVFSGCCIMGASIIFLYDLWFLSASLGTRAVARFLLGVAVLSTSVATISFFQFSPNFYLTVQALRAGLPTLARFTVATLPILFGYALCGVALFGSYSSDFATLELSLLTMFSLLNQAGVGDVERQLMQSPHWTRWVSGVFVSSYIIIMCLAVLNVMLCIVMDGYNVVKDRHRIRYEDWYAQYMRSLQPAPAGSEGADSPRSRSPYQGPSRPVTPVIGAAAPEGAMERLDRLLQEVAQLRADLRPTSMPPMPPLRHQPPSPPHAAPLQAAAQPHAAAPQAAAAAGAAGLQLPAVAAQRAWAQEPAGAARSGALGRAAARAQAEPHAPNEAWLPAPSPASTAAGPPGSPAPASSAYTAICIN